jgi:hypothetical protein
MEKWRDQIRDGMEKNKEHVDRTGSELICREKRMGQHFSLD